MTPAALPTRAMVVTMLWRKAGSPVVDCATSFTDVLDGQWYTDAVRRAADAGVVKGVSNTEFDPNGYVTREALTTMLYRAQPNPGEVSDTPIPHGDADLISDWAKEAMQWAVKEGVLKGDNSNQLNPRYNATRAVVCLSEERKNVMKKRFLGILLAVSMLIGLLPVIPAEAAGLVDSGTCGANLTWTLDDTGLLTISGTGDMENYPRGEDSPWRAYKDDVISLSLPDGLTSIGQNAFITFSSLSTINIPDTVTKVWRSAFQDCPKITEITIPDSVTSIGISAFEGIKKLTSLTMSKNIEKIEDNAFLPGSVKLTRNKQKMSIKIKG